MSINIFFCYARKDETLLKKLMQQLRPLQREGLIETWHDRDISPGTEWEPQINQHLDSADIILLLISPDFMDSNYCYNIEMRKALERHERKEARVIPVILRSVYWQGILGHLQAIPKDSIPVLDPSWYNTDNAFLDIAKNIREVTEELLTQAKTKRDEQELQSRKTQDAKQVKIKRLLLNGALLYGEKRYKEAIADFTEVITLDPKNIDAYLRRARMYHELHKYEKAITDYTQAISLNPTFAHAYYNRGNTYLTLQEYEKALADYTQAIFLDPTQVATYTMRGATYLTLQEYQKAIADYDQALTLNPKHTEAKKWREVAGRKLKGQ